MNRIDFSSSFLKWITLKEKSHGRFQLESACTIIDDRLEKKETFYMAPAVIAGNVYARNDLVKQPAYLFQIAASQERHVIFRTYISNEGGGQYSFDNNGKLFEDVTFIIVGKEAAIITDYHDIEYCYNSSDAISARMNYRINQRYRIEIEFPIKHINIQSDRKLFQVETGPILIASAIPDDRFNERQEVVFNVAFAHFSCFEHADITIKVPTHVGKETISFFSEVRKLKTQIELMVDRTSNREF